MQIPVEICALSGMRFVVFLFCFKLLFCTKFSIGERGAIICFIARPLSKNALTLALYIFRMCIYIMILHKYLYIIHILLPNPPESMFLDEG